MRRSSSKRLWITILTFLILSAGAWATTFIDKKYPGVEAFPKYKEVYIDDIKINENTLTQGQDLEVSLSVYSNTDKETELSSGVFLIDSSKAYNGSNIDYASQKQSFKIQAKSNHLCKWRIPITLEPGNYKLLFWLHQDLDGAEKVLEDNWYPKEIVVKPGAISEIRGEETNADEGWVMSNLLIKPPKLQKNSNLQISYEIANDNLNPSEVETGVFIMQKDKQYDGENIDQSMKMKRVTILPDKKRIFKYDQKLDLPAGKYKLLIWLHTIDAKGGSEVVFDYWAPGNIIVEDK